jgi:hypothetical protein
VDVAEAVHGYRYVLRRWTLAPWQYRQVLAQAVTSSMSPCHTYLEAMRWWVACTLQKFLLTLHGHVCICSSLCYIWTTAVCAASGVWTIWFIAACSAPPRVWSTTPCEFSVYSSLCCPWPCLVSLVTAACAALGSVWSPAACAALGRVYSGEASAENTWACLDYSIACAAP